MKALKLSKDVVTLAEFKSHAAALLERVGSSSQPLLITQNGKPAGVLLSPAEFDRIQEQESLRFVAAVNRGIADADDGRLFTAAEAKSRLGLKKDEEAAEDFFWTENAIQDLSAIKEFISQDSPDQAELWILELFEAGESLSHLSDRGRIVPEFNQENLRELIIENYRMVYRVKPDCVEIITVFEGHRQLKNIKK